MNSQQNVQGSNRNNGQQSSAHSASPIWEYLEILLRGKWIILGSVFLFTGLAVLFSLNTKLYYEASALVLINNTRDVSRTGLDITAAAPTTRITNEIEILQSRSTIRLVAIALRSKAYINEKKTKFMPIVSLPEGAMRSDTLATIREISDRLLGVISFEPVRESDIIKITARREDPGEAAQIANTYAEVFADKNLETARLRSKGIREFLESQLQSKKDLLDASENELQNYMRASGVASLDAEGGRIVQQLGILEGARNAVDVDKSATLKTLASYKEELAKQGQNSAQVMEESNDTYIRQLQEQIARLEVQRDIVIAQNPDLADKKLYADKLTEMNQQIAALRKTLENRTKQFLSNLLPGARIGEGGSSFLGSVKQLVIEQSITLQALDARRKELDKVIQEYENKFQQIPKKNMEMAKLQRKRVSNERLYELLEGKFNETAIQEKSEFGYVNIVDPATVPEYPLSSRKRLYVILGFIAGLGLGVFAAFVWAFMDVRIRTPEDLKRNGFNPFATISSMEGEIKRIEKDITAGSAQYPFDVHLVSFHRPVGPIAESYRHLRMNVLATQAENTSRCIIVTSAVAGEGKTTTAGNLAVSLAHTEKKILLVNADLRRPTIHESFGLTKKKGLAGYLTGEATFEEVRQREVIEHLDIIASGEVPANPSEILGSEKMKEFIHLVKKEYDIILIDAPPLLAVSDSAVLVTEADAVLIVVSAGTTKVNALTAAAELLHNLRVKTLGVVLNKFDIRHSYGPYASTHQYGYYGYESGYFDQDGNKKRSKKSIKKRLESRT